MPIWKRSELRKEFGLHSAYITTYINRGKLKPFDKAKKYFDDSEPVNREFIEKQQAKKQVEEEEPEEEPEEEMPFGQPGPPPPGEFAEAKPKADTGDALQPPAEMTKAAVEAWRSRLNAEKVKEQVEVLRLQKQRQLGNNLPIGSVEQLVSSLIKNYTDAFKEVAENLLTEFGAVAKLSNEQTARFRDQLYKGLNQAGRKANDQSKADMRNLIEYNKEKREKGESKVNVRNKDTA
jgi:polyhydroxyalkanoate synthesis regulator phasin